MAQRFYKIIVAFALSFGICQSMRGQHTGGGAADPLERPHVHADSALLNPPYGVTGSGQAVRIGAVHLLNPPLVVPGLLSPSLYSDHLGFFCREEWRWEKRTGIPIRFRLGSKAYVDYLEGKKQ